MLFRSIIKDISKNYRKSYRYICNQSKAMNLKEVLEKLERFAPLEKAEKWDNVGLLIEPSTQPDIRTIFLTNDLTAPVLKEAVESDANLIISYHPPIFQPLNRITQKTWKERIIAVCLENRIALYSPHTSWDVANGGVNDWLAKQFDFNEISPIKAFPDNPDEGIGRKISLTKPITLSDCIDTLKKHIGIPTVHVALGNNSNINSIIKSVAICAGSGASLLKGVTADLYLSGEMSHHELLDATQNNISVILCNHSNSERGFLKEFKIILDSLLHGRCNILISKTDVDPLSSY